MAHLEVAVGVDKNVAWFEVTVKYICGVDVTKAGEKLIKKPLRQQELITSCWPTAARTTPHLDVDLVIFRL